MKRTHEHASQPNYKRRRAIVGALALTTAIGVGAAGTNQARDAINNIHNMQVSHEFDDPGLANNLKKHNINPADVTRYTIQGGDTPHTIAVKLGAKEEAMTWVEREVAGQGGGEYNLQPNDEIVLPNEQLDQHLGVNAEG